MPDADAFFGKITPPLLAAARRLRWVQSPTASLEHYVFPELVAHPCVLTNMRGLFSDVIADQVMGYVLCFARNLHRLHPAASAARAGSRSAARSARTDVRGRAGRRQRHRPRRTCTWPTARWAIVGLGSIGAEIARRGAGLRHARPRRRSGADAAPDGRRGAVAHGAAAGVAGRERLRRHRRAAHARDGEAVRRRAQSQQMKRTAYLINIGRGAIVDLADLTAALAGGRDRRRGAGRVRDRAAAGRSSAVEDGERDPHAARRRLLAAHRRAASGDAAGEHPPLRARRAADERRR